MRVERLSHMMTSEIYEPAMDQNANSLTYYSVDTVQPKVKVTGKQKENKTVTWKNNQS